MKLYFLDHSGFMVEDGTRAYIFDDWQDPKGIVEKAFASQKELWFFVSHNHSDHYSRAIAAFDRPNTKYFLHKDCGGFRAAQGQVTYMDVDDEVTVEDVTIHMYGSTDSGGSFLVDNGDTRVYHAGDLNWWHWLGDTPENNREARQMFVRELQRMVGVTTDIAFFPVDSRLNYEDPTKEGAREWGLLEWLDAVTVKELLVPMHQHDLEKGGWHPSLHFKAKYETLPLWIPTKPGESCEV